MSPAFTDGREEVAPDVTAQAARRVATRLAQAARRGAIDLADEAAAIEFLEAQGWHEELISAHLTTALDLARGILARARLTGFVGNAVATLVVIAVVAFASPARAGVCTATERDGWSSLAMAAVAMLSTLAGVVVMAALCVSGDVASEEERRDPENMRRS